MREREREGEIGDERRGGGGSERRVWGRGISGDGKKKGRKSLMETGRGERI